MTKQYHSGHVLDRSPDGYKTIIVKPAKRHICDTCCKQIKVKELCTSYQKSNKAFFYEHISCYESHKK